MLPTLVYKDEYPQVDTNWRRIGTLTLWLMPICGVMYLNGIYVISPLVARAVQDIGPIPLSSGFLGLLGQWPTILKHTLLLSLPSTLTWLLGFVAFFHNGLNILAELCGLGGQEFYRNWWAAPSFADFW